MDRPTLVIMAAGLGSRFGGGEGQKQVTPVDAHGHLIIDYSIYDAIRAGFGKIVFVVKPESEEKFHELIGEKVSKYAEVAYAHQTLDAYLPAGFCAPKERVKPWGTGHAALCARNHVPGAFVVINADDFYGRDAYENAYRFLSENKDESEHAMVGYQLRNTMTEFGSVARGVCEEDEHGWLKSVTERVKIVKKGDDAAFTEDGETYEFLPGNTIVSLNFWIFKRSIFDQMQSRFEKFLTGDLLKNPLKQEYYLPSIPNQLLGEGLARVRVLPTRAKWFGMTYMEDLAITRESIRNMTCAGEYPEYLWRQKPC